MMFSITARLSTLISCREYILKGKNGYVINPSQISNKWKQNLNKPNLEKINLLYVGRLRKEKGIFSLVNILKKNSEINLTIVGEENEISKQFNYQNIKSMKIINNQDELIRLYDYHSVFILPSYTEGQPMALIEALSRLRPAIIFKEIEHVIQNRDGIFTSDRNYESLLKTIKYVIKNYDNIQESMKKNNLPTNEEFINNLKKIIIKN